MKNIISLPLSAICAWRAKAALCAARERARAAVMALIFAWLDAMFLRIDTLLAQWRTGAVPLPHPPRATAASDQPHHPESHSVASQRPSAAIARPRAAAPEARPLAPAIPRRRSVAARRPSHATHAADVCEAIRPSPAQTRHFAFFAKRRIAPTHALNVTI